MSDPWIIGQVARVSVALTDAAGAAADPGALTLKIKTPSGTTTSYAFGGGTTLKDGTGAYHADIPLAESGEYRWRWEAAAPSAGADQGYLFVEAALL